MPGSLLISTSSNVEVYNFTAVATKSHLSERGVHGGGIYEIEKADTEASA